MNAIEDMLGKENKVSRDEKPGFLATVPSLPSAPAPSLCYVCLLSPAMLCFLQKPASR
ncbi:MAG: hypothetical protein LUQ38_04555 [Methanotrichaceae archaeon]|nr:hypothetical protein [Methanotrichaceae archaeon]